MKKAVLTALSCFALTIALTGCWDMKSIQDTNYVTAVGCDYKDGQYIIYAQMLDFANVAKQETGGKSSNEAVVWSGHSKGGTVAEAMIGLYETAQQRMFWGHVSSIVFTKRALEHGIDKFKDGLTRFREVRYTQWVYGTEEPLDQLFTTLPFFSQSPLGSILHQPEDNYRQRSYIRPLQLQRAISTYREPGATLLLPSMSIAKNVWKKGGANDPKLYIDGIYAISKFHPPLRIDSAELAGLRWFDPMTKRTNVTIKLEGEPAASITANRPKADIRIEPDESGQIQYSINVRSKFVVQELLKKLDKSEIEQEIRKQVASEIKRTFAYGESKGSDLYQFNHRLYRKQFKLWSKLSRFGEMPVPNIALKSVDVDVELIHTGMYKLTEHGNQY